MPSKVCNHPGCRSRVPMSERYCDAHRRTASAERNREYDKRSRNIEHDRFYHSRPWKEIRDRVMRESGGLCVKCSEIGLIVKADVVDHIVPVGADWSKRLDIENLQPLCHGCHAIKTADDVRRYGEGA